jgi:Rrf2 family protein
MKFSQSLDLALHALWYMARNAPDQPVMIKDLARDMNASESYLARIMLWLTKSGILKSIRGKKGGFIFKIPPEQVTIADVVTAIDTDAADYNCSWEERHCNLRLGCILVNLFQEAQKQMLLVLRRMTIADMVAQGEPGVSERAQWLVPLRDKPETGDLKEDIQNSPQRIAL